MLSIPVTIAEYHAAQGAKVADDGIPLSYTDLLTEYRAALDSAILLDRSHEGRIRLRGGNRADLLQRISTNDVLNLKPGEGRPTIFTNNVGRILDRAMGYHQPQDALTLIGGPGRGQALFDYLRRNIFFRDDVQPELLNPTTSQFNLHGVKADAVIEVLYPDAVKLPPLHGIETTIAGHSVFLAREKPYPGIGTHWVIITVAEAAVEVWKAILDAGNAHGLIAAGSLTFNALRIQSGRPGVGRELTTDFIPLELGLWDEISFNKGCYTGQEIIARMESRSRLAKTIVRLKLSGAVNAPVDLTLAGRRVGTLTSSVSAPDGSMLAIGVLKPSLASPGQTLTIGETGEMLSATVIDLPGVQPPGLTDAGE
ncbi:MAG TPA: hypothetical protein VHL11_11480 [Phototrophicaceae bacterium]|jgi:aminomethyltransferase|nr:hypothetical protein [Phototrophicaceae bacterium]